VVWQRELKVDATLKINAALAARRGGAKNGGRRPVKKAGGAPPGEMPTAEAAFELVARAVDSAASVADAGSRLFPRVSQQAMIEARHGAVEARRVFGRIFVSEIEVPNLFLTLV
jgi:hypothetical protein